MALGLLVLIVLLFGSLLALIALHLLQFVLGVLLLLFGLRWLGKAILRAAGLIPLHNEVAEFVRETDLLTRQASDRRADRLAAIAAFKAVLLEGIEVVFIVLATGTTHGQTAYAAAGALAAVLLVAGLGAGLRRPCRKFRKTR